MQIDLDIQEREVIKQYAQQMLTLFRRQLGNANSNSLSVDAMSIAFWKRLTEKMEPAASPRPKQVWPKRS